MNSLTQGIYGVNGQLTNAPDNTGASMLIIAVAGFIRLEVIFNRVTTHIYYRFKWGDAGYGTWMML